MDKTLRATVMANIDHLFAFAMAAEDARLLGELEGIEVEDITTLDNYMCYVRASLGTKRLPVFSLTIDPPAPGDDKGAQWIRWRSQQRDARPAAVVDDMIAASSTRATSRGLALHGKKGEQMHRPFPEPGDQTPEQPLVGTGTRGRRHSSKSKTSPTREEEVAEPSKERQEGPHEQGWSHPLLYEGAGPDAWGGEEHDHGQ
jgi:hypothetical protein